MGFLNTDHNQMHILFLDFALAKELLWFHDIIASCKCVETQNAVILVDKNLANTLGLHSKCKLVIKMKVDIFDLWMDKDIPHSTAPIQRYLGTIRLGRLLRLAHHTR